MYTLLKLVFVSCILVSYPTLTVCEVQNFDNVIARDDTVHYSGEYLRDPGYVDLSGLTFTLMSGSLSKPETDDLGFDTDDIGDVTDDKMDRENPDTSNPTAIPVTATSQPTAQQVTAAPTSQPDSVTATVTSQPTSQKVTVSPTSQPDSFIITDTSQPTTQQATAAPTSQSTVDEDSGDRQLDGFILGTYVDVVFFREPEDCEVSKDGKDHCDWTSLGIGLSDSAGLTYCCTGDLIKKGICQKEGLLIIDENKVLEHKVVLVPNDGQPTKVMGDQKMKTHGKGRYTLALAVCNNNAIDVVVDGKCMWKSKNGFLPGELLREYQFTIFLTIVYLSLLVWYAMSMKKHREAAIGIQSWILFTISLGLLVMVFKSIDYISWNLKGSRIPSVVYAWIAINVLRGSMSRCLLVMVSLGWGVIRDTLGDQMKKIFFAGILYAALSFAVEATEIAMGKEIQEVNEEKDIDNIRRFFAFAVSIMDLIFYIWILDSLNGTMQYLENMNQSIKLKRYLRLRLILLMSILVAMVVVIFIIVNEKMEGSVVGVEQAWATDAAWDANYLFVLLSVALLWRPNPNAKNLAFVMELPSVEGDGGMSLDTNIDSVDDDERDRIGYRDVSNDHFKIDDGEIS